jgi:hypothetical protein
MKFTPEDNYSIVTIDTLFKTASRFIRKSKAIPVTGRESQ